MRSYTCPDSPHHCSDCMLRNEWCICHTIETIDTAMEFILIRHWREKNRTSNTARLAGLVLSRCSVLDWDQRDDSFALTLPPEGEASIALLFPPDGETHGSPEEERLAPQERPDIVIAVDGSWRQTRRMIRRIPGLQSLPRLFLSPPEAPRERLRTPPKPWAMSTIEAVARAIGHYESEEKATQLEDAYVDLIERMKQQRGAGPLQATSEEREPSAHNNVAATNSR